MPVLLCAAAGLAFAPAAAKADPASQSASVDRNGEATLLSGDAGAPPVNAGFQTGSNAAAVSAAIPFAAHFEGALEPLGPDLTGIDLQVPDTAVDLDTFEPPLETTNVMRDLGSGVASYYGRRFHGRQTANGERFNMRALTAAHRTLPFGSKVRVVNPRNGREVTVRINDRGPFSRGRVIDLSRAAAERIGLIRRGHARVDLELLAP